MPPIYFETESRGVSFSNDVKENVDATSAKSTTSKSTKFGKQVMKPSASAKNIKGQNTIPPTPPHTASTAVGERVNINGQSRAALPEAGQQRKLFNQQRGTALVQHPTTSSAHVSTTTRRMTNSTAGRQKVVPSNSSAASSTLLRSKSLESGKNKRGGKDLECKKRASENSKLIGQRASSVDRGQNDMVKNDSYIQHRRRVKNASPKVETFANPPLQPLSKAIARKYRANSTPPAAPLHFSHQFRVGTTSSWPPMSKPAVITGGFQKIEKDRQQILENQRLLRKLVEISNRKTQFGIAKAASCRTLKFQLAP